MGLNLNFNFNIDKVGLNKLYKEAKAATISKMSAIQSDISINSQVGDLKNNSGLQGNGIETLDLSSNVETANNNNENFNKDLSTKEMNAHNKPGSQSTTFSNMDTNNPNTNGSNSGTLKNSDAPSAIDTNNPNMNGANSGTSGNNSVKPNIQSSNGGNSSLSQSSPSANLNSNNNGLNQGMNSGSGNSSYNNNPSLSNGGVQNGFSGNNSDSGQLNSRDSQGNNMKPYMGQADFSTPQSFIPKVEETKSDFERINIENETVNTTEILESYTAFFGVELPDNFATEIANMSYQEAYDYFCDYYNKNYNALIDNTINNFENMGLEFTVEQKEKMKSFKDIKKLNEYFSNIYLETVARYQARQQAVEDLNQESLQKTGFTIDQMDEGIKQLKEFIDSNKKSYEEISSWTSYELTDENGNKYMVYENSKFGDAQFTIDGRGGYLSLNASFPKTAEILQKTNIKAFTDEYKQKKNQYERALNSREELLKDLDERIAFLTNQTLLSLRDDVQNTDIYGGYKISDFVSNMDPQNINFSDPYSGWNPPWTPGEYGFSGAPKYHDIKEDVQNGIVNKIAIATLYRDVENGTLNGDLGNGKDYCTFIMDNLLPTIGAAINNPGLDIPSVIEAVSVMSDEELKIYNYLFETKGYEEADKWYNELVSSSEFKDRVGKLRAIEAIENFATIEKVDYSKLQEIEYEQLANGKDTLSEYNCITNVDENGEIHFYLVPKNETYLSKIENGKEVYYKVTAIDENKAWDYFKANLNIAGQGFEDGFQSFLAGLNNFFGEADGKLSIENYENYYVASIVSMYKYGETIYQVGYQVGKYSSPTLLSVGGIGKVLNVMSMFGNSYESTLQKGYSAGTTIQYSVAQTALNYADDILFKHIPGLSKMDDVMSKTLFTKMISSGFGEVLEDEIDVNILASTILGEVPEEITNDQRLQTFIVSALTTGVFNFNQIFTDGFNAANYINQKTKTEKYKAENTEPSIKERLSDEVNNAINKVRELAEPVEGNQKDGNLDTDISKLEFHVQDPKNLDATLKIIRISELLKIIKDPEVYSEFENYNALNDSIDKIEGDTTKAEYFDGIIQLVEAINKNNYDLGLNSEESAKLNFLYNAALNAVEIRKMQYSSDLPNDVKLTLMLSNKKIYDVNDIDILYEHFNQNFSAEKLSSDPALIYSSEFQWCSKTISDLYMDAFYSAKSNSLPKFVKEFNYKIKELERNAINKIITDKIDVGERAFNDIISNRYIWDDASRQYADYYSEKYNIDTSRMKYNNNLPNCIKVLLMIRDNTVYDRDLIISAVKDKINNFNYNSNPTFILDDLYQFYFKEVSSTLTSNETNYSYSYEECKKMNSYCISQIVNQGIELSEADFKKFMSIMDGEINNLDVQTYINDYLLKHNIDISNYLDKLVYNNNLPGKLKEQCAKSTLLKYDRFFDSFSGDYGSDQNISAKYISFEIKNLDWLTRNWLTRKNDFKRFLTNELGYKSEDATKLVNEIIAGNKKIIDGKVGSIILEYIYNKCAKENRFDVIDIVNKSLKINFENTIGGQNIERLKIKLMNQGMTEIEALRTLCAIDSTGVCSYAAVVNSILLAFEDKSQKFEDIFGYSMYIEDEAGKRRFNAAELLLDMYTYINSNKFNSLRYNGKMFIFDSNGNLHINGALNTNNQVYLSSRYPSGVWNNVRAIDEFLHTKDSNLYFKVEKILDYGNRNIATKIEVEKVKEQIINYLKSNINNSVELGIYKVKGKEVRFFDDSGKHIIKTTNTWNEGGAHAVCVTGIIDDFIIVSSWGMRLKIPISDFINNMFDVTFRNIEEEQNEIYYSNNVAEETLSLEPEISEAKSPSFEHQASTGIGSKNNEVLDSIMNKLGTVKGRRSLLLYTNTGNINHIPQEFRSLIEALPKENIKDYLGIQDFDIGIQFFGSNTDYYTNQIMAGIAAMDARYKNDERYRNAFPNGTGIGLEALKEYIETRNPSVLSTAGNFRQIVTSLDRNTLVNCYNEIVANINSKSSYNFEHIISMANYHTGEGQFYTIDIDNIDDFKKFPSDFWSKINDPSEIYFRTKNDGKWYKFSEAKGLSGADPIENLKTNNQPNYNLYQRAVDANFKTRKGIFYIIPVDSFENIPSDFWSKIDNPELVSFSNGGKVYTFTEAQIMAGITAMDAKYKNDVRYRNAFPNGVGIAALEKYIETRDPTVLSTAGNFRQTVTSLDYNTLVACYTKIVNSMNSSINSNSVNIEYCVSQIKSAMDIVNTAKNQDIAIYQLYEYLKTGDISKLSRNGNFRNIIASLDPDIVAECYNRLLAQR